MNWIKNVGKMPDAKRVHIKLNTFENGSIEGDIKYYQVPKNWDWQVTSGGIQITQYYIVKEQE